MLRLMRLTIKRRTWNTSPRCRRCYVHWVSVHRPIRSRCSPVPPTLSVSVLDWRVTVVLSRRLQRIWVIPVIYRLSAARIVSVTFATLRV